MPSWGVINQEILTLQRSGEPAFLDLVRRKYITSQYAHSKRAVILYASKWTQPTDGIQPELISVGEEDVQGLMEVIHGVKEVELDLILHSPGGSIAAADAFVQYLRSKFKHIRVFVPYAAMSAATMIACAADEIVMGKHSFLGPIDPQFIMHTSLGARSIPAQTILDQFKIAMEECKDPRNLAVWLPMIQQYGPDLLVQCGNVLKLSKELVQDWLKKNMFNGEATAEKLSQEIASWLSNHSEFKTHSKHINRDQLRDRGMKILNLEDDQKQQDFILSIFHATTATFSHSGAVKIIENHLGHAYINQVQQILVQQGMGPQNNPLSPPGPVHKAQEQKKKRWGK